MLLLLQLFIFFFLAVCNINYRLFEHNRFKLLIMICIKENYCKNQKLTIK